MATRSRTLLLVGAAAALAACATPRSRTTPSGSSAPPSVEPQRAIAPVGRIDEAPLGAAPPAAPAARPAPAPPAAVRATSPPEEPSPTAAILMEPAPLVAQIGPSTPPNVAAAFRLIEDGRHWQARGGRTQAREQFERAVAIDPTNAYGYFFLARVHYLNRSYDQAIAFASRAVALGARLDPAWLGRIYALQGAVFEEAGRYPDARTAYRQAVATDPHNLAAQVGLVRVSGSADAAPPPP